MNRQIRKWHNGRQAVSGKMEITPFNRYLLFVVDTVYNINVILNILPMKDSLAKQNLVIFMFQASYMWTNRWMLSIPTFLQTCNLGNCENVFTFSCTNKCRCWNMLHKCIKKSAPITGNVDLPEHMLQKLHLLTIEMINFTYWPKVLKVWIKMK